MASPNDEKDKKNVKFTTEYSIDDLGDGCYILYGRLFVKLL